MSASAPRPRGRANAGRRAAASLRLRRPRLGRLRSGRLTIAQGALAASLAWVVAAGLLGHENPFFAPIAASSAVGASVERRTRRMFEIVIGVALGVLIGDAFIGQVGTGWWQIGLVVALAMSAAIMLNAGAIATLQASSTAIVIATVTPPTPSDPVYFERFFDALVGGGVGIMVTLLVIPLQPIRTVRKVADPLMDAFAAALEHVAQALETRDEGEARAALAELRGVQVSNERLRAAVLATSEVVAFAPIRWRDRERTRQYAHASRHLEHAVNNARVLARQAVYAARQRDPLPPNLAEAVRLSARAISELKVVLGQGDSLVPAQEAALAAAEEATEALQHTSGLAGQVVAAEVRTLAADVLYATGITYEQAVAMLPNMPPPRMSTSDLDQTSA